MNADVYASNISRSRYLLVEAGKSVPKSHQKEFQTRWKTLDLADTAPRVALDAGKAEAAILQDGFFVAEVKVKITERLVPKGQ